MNIFILSWCTKQCAAWHFDKHVIKMIIELAQLLCTAHWQLNKQITNERRYNKKLIYKQTHINHPCAIWVRCHINNYRYTVKLAKALCEEYYIRYGFNRNKRHKTERIIDFLSRHEPHNWSQCDKVLIGPHSVTNPPQAMLDKYKDQCVITAYRKYYQSPEKEHLQSWKNRETPDWFHNLSNN